MRGVGKGEETGEGPGKGEEEKAFSVLEKKSAVFLMNGICLVWVGQFG